MNKRVDELLREALTLDPPKLLSSPKEIKLKLRTGQRYVDSFRVGTDECIKVSGRVYSDNRRIVVAEDNFMGVSCTIQYEIDIRGLKDADKVSGNINIITNMGEMAVPVDVLIEEALPAPYEEIKDLDDFSRLASTNFREAFQIFTNDNFKGLLKGRDSRYLALYKGLSQNPVTYRHLEEFLIAAEKKEPVRLSVDRQTKLSYVLNNSMKETLYIFKSTWGFTRIEVEVHGGFIEVTKDLITSDDFIGKSYGLEYILHKEKLRGRKDSGKIILKTVYGSIEVEIEVRSSRVIGSISAKLRKERKLKLYRQFLDFKLEKLDYSTWYDNAKRYVEEMEEEAGEEKEGLFPLFADAYLAYRQGDRDKLTLLLRPIRAGRIKLSEAWENSAYIFLAKKADMLPEKKKDIAAQLYAYHQARPSEYFIFDLFLEETGGFGGDFQKVFYELERMYELGCNSPFLYLTAWKSWDNQDARLRKLSDFAIRVLAFAAKEGLLTENMLLRAAFLTANVKGFKPALYKLLAAGYEKYGSLEALEAICRHIMNDNPLNKAYHKWYKMAAEQNIRLTRLYEYYIETKPDNFDDPIPTSVKFYFSYAMTISERKKALLYASVVRDKDKDPALYELYEEIAKDFAASSIKEGRINEFYAILYKEFFGDCKDAETAGYFAGVLFKRKLTCDNPNMKRVVVCHAELNDTQSYPLIEGAAYPQIYNDNVCVLFEDEKKRRFVSTVNYKLESILDIETTARRCMLFGVWDTGMQIYFCHERRWRGEINRHNIASFFRAAENTDFTGEYRNQIRQKLLTYFVGNGGEWGLLPYAERIDELTYGLVDKEKTFEFLVTFSQHKKALNLVESLGYEGISPSILMKLAIHLIEESNGERDVPTLRLALYVYRNECFNDEILEYISEHAVLGIDECEELWRRMTGFNVDTYELEGKYLLLSMEVIKLTESSEKILEEFIHKGGRLSIWQAYVNLLAMYYLFKGRALSNSTVETLERLCAVDPSKSILRNITLAKIRSEASEITETQMQTLKKAVEYCVKRNLRFDFFKKLPQKIVDLCEMDDKVFAQEYFPFGSSVTIYYKIDRQGATAEEWKSEPMHESIRGLYVREFLLFYGEELCYYCKVESRDGIYETSRKTLTTDESSTRGKTRYTLLNRMLMLKKLGAHDKMDMAMKQYLEQEAFVDNMFRLKE